MCKSDFSSDKREQGNLQHSNILTDRFDGSDSWENHKRAVEWEINGQRLEREFRMVQKWRDKGQIHLITLNLLIEPLSLPSIGRLTKVSSRISKISMWRDEFEKERWMSPEKVTFVSFTNSGTFWSRIQPKSHQVVTFWNMAEALIWNSLTPRHWDYWTKHVSFSLRTNEQKRGRAHFLHSFRFIKSHFFRTYGLFRPPDQMSWKDSESSAYRNYSKKSRGWPSKSWVL
jgi:hypothetical protein